MMVAEVAKMNGETYYCLSYGGGGERRAIAQFVATGEGGGEPVSRRPR